MSFTSLRARVPHILLITAGTWTSASQIISHMKCKKLNMKEPYKGNEHVHTASGSDTGRGARLEIHEESSSPPPSPRSPVQDDRMDEAPSMQPHGTPASAREPGPEDGSGPSVRISPRRVSPGVSTGAPSARATDALAGSASHAHEPGSASPVHARGEQPSHVRSDSTRLTSPVRPDPTSPMMDITSPSTASGKPGTITQSPRVERLGRSPKPAPPSRPLPLGPPPPPLVDATGQSPCGGRWRRVFFP
nr:uncharacterized protein LOC127339927 [Lolium perenne]